LTTANLIESLVIVESILIIEYFIESPLIINNRIESPLIINNRGHGQVHCMMLIICVVHTEQSLSTISISCL